MNKTLLLILLLSVLGIAALDVPTGDTTIKATYENPIEPVGYINTYIEPATTPFWTGTTAVTSTEAHVLIREALGLVLGTHYYAITADDNIGNQAIHGEVIKSTNDDLLITLTEPGVFGQASDSKYRVLITTAQRATCSWRFWSPDNTNDWNVMDLADRSNTLHTINDFNTTYRFLAGEHVPIDFRCERNEGTTTIYSYLTIPIGRDDGTHPLVTTITVPRAITSTTHPEPRLEVHTDELISCKLDGTTTLPGMHHRFIGLSIDTEYELECRDASGAVVKNYDFSIPTAGEGPPPITITTPQKTPTQTIISAVTGGPARCFYEVNGGGNTALGPLSDYLLHQRAATITGPKNIDVRCTSYDGTYSATESTTINGDDLGPGITINSATSCEDRAILHLTRGSTDISHYTLTLGDNTVLRTWPEDKDAIVVQQYNPEGATSINVQGYDSIGNPGTPKTPALTTNNDPNCKYEGYDQDIILINPVDGLTSSNVWDLVVSTELDSTCTATTGSNTVDMEGTGKLHSAYNYNDAGPTKNDASTVTITCEDFAGFTTERTFTIRWYIQEAEITAVAVPTTVTDKEAQYSTVVVTANQEVTCALDDDEFDQTYNNTRYLNVPMPYGIGSRSVVVWCYNGLYYANDTVTIQENIPSTLLIDLTSNNLTNKAPVPITIKTDRSADCVLTGAATGTLNSENGLVHTGTYTMTEGIKSFTATCTETLLPTKIGSKLFRITVDRTPPTYTLTGPLTTCGPDTYLVAASITENRGVKDINITLNNKHYRFGPSKIADGVFSVELTGLNLTPGTQYTLTFVASDNAGNIGNTITRTIIAAEPGGGACDTEAPTGTLHQQDVNEGAEVWITCTDNIGCTTPYHMSIGAAGGACNYFDVDPSEKRLVTQTSKVCYLVSDASGNEDEDYVTIVIDGEYPDSCDNGIQDGDEEGEDCGGSCPACPGTVLDCTDTGCDNGYKCDPVSKQCKEIIGPSCSTSNPCPDGMVCLEGDCVDDPTSCTITGCSADYECDTSDGECKPKTNRECSASNPCPEGEKCVNYECVVDGGGTPAHCHNTVQDGDETDVDCGGSCEQCTTDDLCPAFPCDEGYTCKEETGECKEIIGPSCSTSNPCPDGMVCLNENCVDDPTSCTITGCSADYECDTSDGDCKPTTGETCSATDPCPNGQKCVEEKCVIDDPGYEYCDEDSDCDPPYKCLENDDGDLACLEIPGTPCDTHDDCDGDSICSDEGMCVQQPPDWCWDDEECGGTNICGDNNKCQHTSPVYCDDSEDCGPDQVCLSTGICGVENPVTCDIDTDCGPNQVCDDNTCVTPIDTCSDNEDCGPGQTCLANGHCGLPSNNTCGNGVQCPVGELCEDNQCYTPITDYCEDDDACGEDMVCTDDNTCAAEPVDTCTTDGDCGFNRECVGGDCYSPLPDPCTKDIQCGPGQTCDEDSGLCVEDIPDECTRDRDCGSGNICIDGDCYSPDPQPCTDDGDCPEGRYCELGICALRQPPKKDGPTCKVASDCDSGVCNEEGYCAPPNDDDCINNKKDCEETDVDCGGPYAPPCGINKKCDFPSDCESRTCISGTCREPSCTDGQPNGKETDTDCGGPDCNPCAIGKGCIDVDTLEPMDEYCQSGICAYGECASERPPPDITEPGDTGDTGWDPGDNGYTPPTKDSIWPALIFILLGILLAGGGAGYIFYEKQEEEKTRSKKPSSTNIAFGTPAGGTGLGSVKTSKPSYQDEDFSSSKLREEARSKRRNQRRSKRKNLLSAFEDDASKEISEDTEGTAKDSENTPTKTDKDPATKAATKTKTAKPAKKRTKAATPKKKAPASKEIMEETSTKTQKPTSTTSKNKPSTPSTTTDTTTPKNAPENKTTKSAEATKKPTTTTPTKKTPVVPPPKNTLKTTPIHQEFKKAKTPAALEELAKEFLDKGDANKHEISSALKDLESAGNVKKKTVDDLHKKLEL